MTDNRKTRTTAYRELGFPSYIVSAWPALPDRPGLQILGSFATIIFCGQRRLEIMKTTKSRLDYLAPRFSTTHPPRS